MGGFDTFEVYWEVFDPYADEPRVASSLSDDLLDIYFDVRRGLDLWKSKAPGGPDETHQGFTLEQDAAPAFASIERDGVGCF